MKPRHYESAEYVDALPEDAARRLRLRKDGLELQGPIVPAGFTCDGCSLPVPPWPRWLRDRCQDVVDGRWLWACRIHDFEYAQLRKMAPRTRYWKNRRYQADSNFRANIAVILRSKRTGWLDWIAYRWVSRTYYKGVRLFGASAATGPH